MTQMRQTHDPKCYANLQLKVESSERGGVCVQTTLLRSVFSLVVEKRMTKNNSKHFATHQNKHTMQTQVKKQTPRRLMAAEIKAAKAQAAVDVWEAQVAATNIALKMMFEDDMREERAAEARKNRADSERLEANARAIALKRSGLELIEAAHAARMAAEKGQAAQRLKLEKLMYRGMR